MRVRSLLFLIPFGTAVAWSSPYYESPPQQYAFAGSGGGQGRVELEFIAAGSIVRTLSAIDTGWFENGLGTGGGTGLKAYFTGCCDRPAPFVDNVFRSYFVFNLAAIFRTPFDYDLVYLNVYEPPNGYRNDLPATHLQLYLYDVSTPIDQLTVWGRGRFTIWDDLGTGLTYGSVILGPSGPNGAQIHIGLNANGYRAIQANKDGMVAIGGSLVSLPEPGSAGTALTALTLLAACRLRRSRIS